MAPIIAGGKLVSLWAGKAASVFTSHIKRILKNKWPTGDYTMLNESKFTELPIGSKLSAAVPLPVKVNYFKTYLWWRYVRYHTLKWSDLVSEEMLKSLNIENYATKKAAKVLDDTKAQQPVIEFWLDFVSNLINGIIAIVILWIVIEYWEKEGKEKEKAEKEKLKRQFQELSDATESNLTRIAKLEAKVLDLEEQVEHLRPTLMRLLVLLNAHETERTPGPQFPSANELPSHLRVIELDAQCPAEDETKG